MIVFGLQEMIELKTNNIVNESADDSKMAVLWGKMIEKELLEMGGEFLYVQKQEMVGLFLIIFVSNRWKESIKSVHCDLVKTGQGGLFGNKGAVVIRVKIYETTICFSCAHLAAGPAKVNERIDDFVTIHRKAFQQNQKSIQN